MFFACVQNQRGPLAGASEASEGAPERAPPTRAPPASSTWESYALAKSWPILSKPFISRGHLPTQTVDVRADPASRALYLALVTDSVFPAGSLLLEVSHAGTGAAYAMQKTFSGWTFFELDETGRVRSSGMLPLCQGCHAQAPSDGVFGLPRDLEAAH